MRAGLEYIAPCDAWHPRSFAASPSGSKCTSGAISSSSSLTTFLSSPSEGAVVATSEASSSSSSGSFWIAAEATRAPIGEQSLTHAACVLVVGARLACVAEGRGGGKNRGDNRTNSRVELLGVEDIDRTIGTDTYRVLESWKCVEGLAGQPGVCADNSTSELHDGEALRGACWLFVEAAAKRAAGRGLDALLHSAPLVVRLEVLRNAADALRDCALVGPVMGDPLRYREASMRFSADAERS